MIETNREAKIACNKETAARALARATEVFRDALKEAHRLSVITGPSADQVPDLLNITHDLGLDVDDEIASLGHALDVWFEECNYGRVA